MAFWNSESPDNESRKSKPRQTRDSKTRKGGVPWSTSKCLFSMFFNFTCPYNGVSCDTERSPGGTLGELEKSTQRPETSIYTAFNANGIGAPSGQKTAPKSTEEKSARTGPKSTKNEQKSTVQNTSEDGPIQDRKRTTESRPKAGRKCSRERQRQLLKSCFLGFLHFPTLGTSAG
jgi:hypothetical protein